MKRLLVLVVIPLMLFGLERVNLIKNHSFEKENSFWKAYTGTRISIQSDSAKANSHDESSALDGMFSASSDTRSTPQGTPSPLFFDSATVIQGCSIRKQLKDLDSIFWFMKVIPMETGYSYTCATAVTLQINLGESDWQWCLYWIHGPRLNDWGGGPHDKSYNFDLIDDTSWIEWKRSINNDWITGRGLSPDALLDSIGLVGYGRFDAGWMGQKAYWDDIRLTGYADYDVGIKGILSGDSVWKNTGYKPTARIKNFGRKAADSFLVIAAIEGGSGVVYADTLPYALPADTEDTVSFKEFTPPDASNYTLTVSTLMTPDESDEDDEMSKTLYGSGIEEQPISSGFVFEVSSFTRNTPSSLLVSYSIPNSEQGIISLYDLTGRRVESLKVVGSGQVTFKVGLASGVYFVELETEKTSVTKKAVVLK